MGCKKRMVGCPVTCGHFVKVDDYRKERARQEQAAEDVHLGYEAERRDRQHDTPAITFKDWLIGTRRPV